jgi:pimeloyl-ACP methyl ester carboxylesterase
MKVWKLAKTAAPLPFGSFFYCVLWSATTRAQAHAFSRSLLVGATFSERPTRVTLASKVNGDGRGTEGRTGWNHSQPEKTSKFWKESVEQRAETEEEGTPSKRLRTGWLHNSQSREELVKANKAKASNDTPGGGTSPARRLLELAMKQQERDHRVVAPVTFHACGDDTVVAVTEHKLSVPLLREKDSTSENSFAAGERIDVFFTVAEKIQSEGHKDWLSSLLSLSPAKRASVYVEHAGMKTADRMLLYLQGGPGFGAPIPAVNLGFSKGSSWAAQALSMGSYDRVVFMDQRGTGKSTTLTKQSLEKKFPDLFLLDSPDDLSKKEEKMPAVKQAINTAVDYMSQFRADNIVQDAEEIRDALLLPLEGTPAGESNDVRPWGACLGQSFGGFCIMTYLSMISNPPKICLLTGGIAPMNFQAYDLYASLWQRVKERSLLYYDMYPADIALVKKIVRRLLKQPEPLPSGGQLTARRFLQLGLALGGSPSSFASLHAFFQSAFLQGTEDDELPEFKRAFLKEVEINQSFDDHPIYFWLHESIYANGGAYSPTRWAAHRSYEDAVSKDSAFDYVLTSTAESDKPVLLFGEMTFPWMSEDFAELRGVGLSEVAEAIANKDDWKPLFDADHMREVLSSEKTRAAASVYVDDMYVDFDCCRKLTARGGPLEKCKVWISNDYQHSGLRDAGAHIFEKLHGMATGSIRTPS